MPSARVMDIPFFWLTDDRDLVAALERHTGDEVALDTEFSMGVRYGCRLCVVQLGWRDEIVLVDAQAVNVGPLEDLFASSSVITHAGHNDYEVLDEAVGRRPASGFDTQVAARFLGYPEPGLHALTTELLGIELDKSQQRVDWTRRPLSEKTLHYAASDVAHLFDLRDAVVERLVERGRLDWVLEDCAAYLEWYDKDVEPTQLWWHVKNRKLIPRTRRLAAQRLAIVRDKWAESFDRPPSHIFNDVAFLEIAKADSPNAAVVRNAVHRRWATDEFVRDVLHALRPDESEAELDLPPRPESHRDFADTLDEAVAYVRATAEAMDLLPAVLGSRRDVLDYLAGRPSRLDGGWRAPFVGEKLQTFRERVR
jgi:ribonuclease D